MTTTLANHSIFSILNHGPETIKVNGTELEPGDSESWNVEKGVIAGGKVRDGTRRMDVALPGPVVERNKGIGFQINVQHSIVGDMDTRTRKVLAEHSSKLAAEMEKSRQRTMVLNEGDTLTLTMDGESWIKYRVFRGELCPVGQHRNPEQPIRPDSSYSLAASSD